MGSLSILPCLLSTTLVLIPSLVLLYCLVKKQKYDLLGFLILSNISAHIFMIKCIIPQTLLNRERDPQLLYIPKLKHIDDEKKYLIPNKNLNIYSKYCSECKIHRPPRAIHCNLCNHCVQKYDHHCPWLSVCIGKFNYIYFMGYICSITSLCLYVFAVCLSSVVQGMQNNFHITYFVVQIVLGLLAIFFGIAIGRLLIYHFVIIYQKMTTNQHLKNTYPQKVELPFNRCYWHDRKALFDQKTQYYMDKNFKSQYQKQENPKRNNDSTKQIMLTNLIRDLNDSTSSSSSVVSPARHYSIKATERTSIFNYLLENQHQ